MIPTPPLLIGLGGFGAEVLRQLGGSRPCRRTWIDQRAEVYFAGGCGCGCQGACGAESSEIPAIGLAGEEAREALLRMADWQANFPWLPDGKNVRWLSEIGARSTSGFRVLGRMSLTRSHRLLDARLREVAGGDGTLPPREVFLIAGADGGTGSAILADVTLLLRRLLPRATFYALLALPPEGMADRQRFEAGALASLFEISEIYGGHDFHLSLEGETTRLPRDPLAELWQRIFLFRSEEPAPALQAAKVIAEALALLIDPEVAAVRGRWPEARVDSDLARARPFSAGTGFHTGFPFAANVGGPRHNGQGYGPPAASASAAPTRGGGAGSGREPDSSFVFRASAPAKTQREEWEHELDELYEGFRSLRAAEQKIAVERLRAIEDAILDLPEDRFKTPEDWAQREKVTLTQHRDDLKWLQKAPDRRRIRWRPPIWRNFEFEQRVNIARKLLEGLHPEKVGAAAFRIDAPGRGESTAETAAPSASSGQSSPEKSAVSVDPKGYEDFVRWLETRHQRPLFNTSYPDGERRLRALVLAPEEVQKLWASALRDHLGIEPEVQTGKVDTVRVWIEDLYHPLDDIERLGAFRAQYDAYPDRALLHTDRTFGESARRTGEDA